MTTINLSRKWKLGNQLASGGFGRVHEAEADDSAAAVVKLVPKAPGASRELLFEELSGSPNIIPILDTGEFEDYYVLVMPRAEKSLRKHLGEAGRLEVNEAVVVLTDVAEALASLEAEVVHRDLKPDNVLLHEGHWCLADFGIARYAEATTASDTRKFAMTPEYAAPERWKGERATTATDVYAFGAMAFELLKGELPFHGPDFREQHLCEAPPALAGCPPTLASLIAECLYKAPGARPSPTNILARLRARERGSSPGTDRLEEVNRVVVGKRAEEAARLSAEQTRDESRQQLYEVAKQSLHQVVETLHQRVLELASGTDVTESNRTLVLTLGDGTLSVDHVEMAPPHCLAGEGFSAPFDVIAHSAVAVRKPQDKFGYEGRAHSLWFCDAQEAGVYRWYELAFMTRPSVALSFRLNPAALAPDAANARRALAPVEGVCQVAWEPVPFDQGEEEQFVERWIGWFAAAADGTLSVPRYMPEESGGNRRRAEIL